MELPNWPPEAGGPFDPRNHRFAISADEVLIEKITSAKGKQITFTCTLDGKQHTYDSSAPDEKIAEKLGRYLELTWVRRCPPLGQ